LDRSLPRQLLENTPEAYQQSKGTLFGPWIFTRWIIRAILHSLCIFFVPVLALGERNVARSDGLTHDLWFTSTICYYAVVLVPTFMIWFEMQSYTLIHALAMASSLFTLFIVVFVINYLRSIDPDLYGIVNELYSSASFWFVLALTVSIPLIVELAFRAFKRHLAPTYTQMLQEYNYRVKQFYRNKNDRVGGSGDVRNGDAKTPESRPDFPRAPKTPATQTKASRQREEVLDRLKLKDKKTG